MSSYIQPSDEELEQEEPITAIPQNAINVHNMPRFVCKYALMVTRVVEFSSGGYKLEIFLPKNQHTQRKLLNFDNWCSGELSKIGHHFRKMCS